MPSNHPACGRRGRLHPEHRSLDHRSQGFRSLWWRLFPGLATAEGRVCPETRDPRASLGQAHLNGMTAPPEDGFGQQRGTPTIFQGHRRLQGTPSRSSHFGGRQAYIGDLRRSKRRMEFQR
jgi:hypothetical protein